VIFVDAGGDGGAGSTSIASSSYATTGTGASCDELEKQMDEAIDDAIACDPTIDTIQCDGSEVVPNACGCKFFVLNEKHPDLVAAAKASYAAWTNAGCGPLDCGMDCVEAMGGTCEPLDQGAQCIGLTLD
jgi:hypothetical protein